MTAIIFGYITMTVLGLIAGSFAGATVWRLRARQLVADKKIGEPVDAKELKRLKPLAETRGTKDRSRCLMCQHELSWYDLLPLVSWASTGGKCRYCKKRIGWYEPLAELGTAALFVTFYSYWIAMYGATGSIALLIVWIVILTMLAILFIYDLKWFILPDIVVFPLIGLACIPAVYSVMTNEGELVYKIISVIGSVGIIGGLYLVLYILSKGMWIGFGDVKLGVALGLMLADWKLAFLALFLANLIGTLVIIPGLVRKKLTRTTQVPFGPFLIAGFVIALCFGLQLIIWYEKATLSLLATMLML